MLNSQFADDFEETWWSYNQNIPGVCTNCVRYQRLQWGLEAYRHLKSHIAVKQQKGTIQTVNLNKSNWMMQGERASCKFTNIHYTSVVFCRD